MTDMKRGSSLISIMSGIAASILVTVFSAGSASAETTLEKAKSSGSVTVGIFNQAPWGFRDKDGTIKGQSTDVLKAALKPLGITKFNPVITEFGALIPGLVSGRFDVIAAGLYIRPQRCKSVAFGNPDLQLWDGLMVMPGNPENLHSFKDIVDNPKIKLGSVRGTINAKNAVASGVSKDRLILYSDHEAGISALIGGRVHSYTAVVATIIALEKRAGGAVERAQPFEGRFDEKGNPKLGFPGIGFRLEDADFRDAYNDQLKRMRDSGELLSIAKAYGFAESELPPANLTAATLCED